MDAPGLGRLAEPRCHAHQHADRRVLRVDVLKSPNITPYAGCMIFWNLAQSRHADENGQAVPFLLLRESNPHSQLHKLMTYVQQNLPQSIHQIADVCLLHSKGRNGLRFQLVDATPALNRSVGFRTPESRKVAL